MVIFAELQIFSATDTNSVFKLGEPDFSDLALCAPRKRSTCAPV